jgi:GT2 family glycosyltransferase
MDTATSLSEYPLVSVVILNYKRREALLRVLDSVRMQVYANREIILVDNNSEDGICQFIEDYAPEVELIELQQNRGACGGRNAGIERARGEIVITLDNDIYLESALELSKVVNTFQARPGIHVIAFQLCDSETGELRVREWCHPRNWQKFGQSEFETNYFVEGACAFRCEVFGTTGLYYAPLFVYGEGHDLALRFLDRGFRILYAPQIRARHQLAPGVRNHDRTYYLHTRNYIWIAYKDYHFSEGVSYLFPKLLMMVYFTLRTGCFRGFLRGLKDGVMGLGPIHRERTPISPHTARYFAELEKLRPNWIQRFARHKMEPQL